MTTYAVTGASGQLGRKIVQSLLDLHISPFDVIALARDTAKVEDLAELGVRTRRADYNEPASLDAALEGVDRLVLVSSSEVGQRAAQHKAVLEAAEKAGVQRIAYTSLLKADSSSLGLAPEHVATEEMLTASSIETTFLRNSWYTENYTAQIPGYVERGAIVGAAGDAQLSTATRGDFADAAAAAITADTVKPVYELAGATYTFAELAAAISAATGKDVVYTNVTVEELAAGMVAAGMDEGTAGFWASIDAGIAAGDLYTDSTDLADLIGRTPTTLEDAVKAAL
ncbi:NmrA family NAD(P)-binding protein [Demequina zhanjiangensis]|uniref:NmrA family NAD(P)-binding protein n=1 Tax=Demequina zhanjiangensis TaxID=3051659 RepID=A0ABT8FY97_9MICO|nr:NmrA family NAD(P)-binding protein [Demequina sp. SYSU T00b26]MDN4471742.1 NmrA family NAD(P)-binding protein [Demequina sp. SYSU T00b26]